MPDIREHSSLEDEYPDNSDAARREKRVKVKKRKLEGSARVKEDSMLKTAFKDMFVTDIKDLGAFVYDNVMDMAKDLAMDTLEKALYKGGGRRRSRSSSIDEDEDFTEYSKKKKRSSGTKAKVKTPFYETLYFSKESDAKGILKDMKAIFEKQEYLTVLQFCDLVGQQSKPQDDDYGWDSLEGVEVIFVRGNGYKITLPRAKMLEFDDE